MTTSGAANRRVLTTCTAAVIAVTLSACGGTTTGEADSSNDGPATTRPAPTATAAPASSAGADQATGTVTKDASPVPTLPPGDPGTDAPGTDDPNGDLGNDTPPAHPKDAKAAVPKTAVLDAETVASVAGGTWSLGQAPADSCAAPRPAGLVATRSTQLSSSGTGAATGDSSGATGSRLVETVSTHHGARAAIAAVRALERRLTGCHATAAPDPRIGDASVQLTLTALGGTVTVVTAAAVEGVTFVLSGSGPVTVAKRWSALTDIALGSTCVASLDGCH